MPKYDYLIVGAGLSGAVCAHELKKKGYNCLVVEKRGQTAHTDIIILYKIMKKRILILSITAGNGHNACANSMKRKLESLDDADGITFAGLRSSTTLLTAL